MCGIAGAVRFGEEPINADALQVLLCKLQTRGTDAAGIAIQNDGEAELHVYKTDDPAWDMVSSAKYKAFVGEHLKKSTRSVLLHTRAATCGSPRQNENNHPLFAGKSAVVHNGIISNHGELFRTMELKREAETDSDVLRAIVDKFGMTKEALQALQKVRGSCAAAILHPEFPRKIMLLRSGSPLVFCKTPGELFLFASEKDALHMALRTWSNWKGLWLQENRTNVVFNTMSPDTGYLIGPDGLECREEFASCGSYTGPTYRVWDRYAERQNGWDSKTEKPQFAACPTCKDKNGNAILIKIEKHHEHMPLWELMHSTCKTRLAEKPKED